MMRYFWFIFILLLALFAVCFFWRPSSKYHKKRIMAARRVRDLMSSGLLSEPQAMSYLRKINPYTFEELVLEGFKDHGYNVKRNRRYTGDGGVDGRVSRNGTEYLIQCKRYSGYISRRHVEDFSRICTRECRKGFFVHTGKTGEGARDVSGSFGNVDIISGDRLLRVVGFNSKMQS